MIAFIVNKLFVSTLLLCGISLNSVNAICDSNINCGSLANGCKSKCPFGFPCVTNADCVADSCTGGYCDISKPTMLRPVPPPSSNNFPPPTWSNSDIKSMADFGLIVKDAYGKTNRFFVPDPVLGPSKTVFQVRYPANSYKPSNKANVGGTGFYATPIDLSKSKIVTLEYKVFFPTGYQFVKGGKLPGLFGGHPSCSGGNAAVDCFSTRFMWRPDADGEIYLYVDQSKQVPGICLVPPRSVCNPAYGISVGRGAYKFNLGSWTKVRQRIALNDIGKTNGELVVWVDGVQKISFKQVSWRNMASVGFIGLDFETFFGGSDATWASPKEQFTYYKDFSLTVE